MWYAAVDCSRSVQRRLEKLGRRRLRVGYGEQTVCETKRNADAFETPTLLDDAVRQRGMTVPGHEDICKPERQLVIYPPWDFQPVQLAERRDMIALWWREDEPWRLPPRPLDIPLGTGGLIRFLAKRFRRIRRLLLPEYRNFITWSIQHRTRDPRRTLWLVNSRRTCHLITSRDRQVWHYLFPVRSFSLRLLRWYIVWCRRWIPLPVRKLVCDSRLVETTNIAISNPQLEIIFFKITM